MEKSVKASVKRATPLSKALAFIACVAVMIATVFGICGNVSNAYAQDGVGTGMSPGHGGISVGSWTNSCGWFDKGSWAVDENGDPIVDSLGRKVWNPTQGWGDDSIQWFYDNIVKAEMGTGWLDYGSPGMPGGSEAPMRAAMADAIDNAVADARARYVRNKVASGEMTQSEAEAAAREAIKKARIVAVGWMWGPAGYGVYTPNVGDDTDGVYNHEMIWRPGYIDDELTVHVGDRDNKKEAWTNLFDEEGKRIAHERAGHPGELKDCPICTVCTICDEGARDTWRHHVWCHWQHDEDIWKKGGAQFVAIAVAEGEPGEVQLDGDIMLTKTSRNPKVSGDNLTENTSNWKTTIGYTPENIVYVVTDSKNKQVGAFVLDKHGVGYAAEKQDDGSYKIKKDKSGDSYPYVHVDLNKAKGDTFYVQEQVLLADGQTRIEMQGFKRTPTKYEILVTDKNDYNKTASKNNAIRVWGENEVLVTGDAIRKDTVSNEIILPTLKITKHAGKGPDGKDITTGNNCYDLKDAVFEICKSRDFSSSKVYRMTTKSDGRAYTNDGKLACELEDGLGTYYVREARAPYEGYEPDASKKPYEWDGANAYTSSAKYTKTVTFNAFYPASEADKAVDFTDDPLIDPINLRILKVDEDTGEVVTGAEGAATLAGAVYEVSFYKGVTETRGSVLATREPDARAQWRTMDDGLIDLTLDPTVNGTMWKYNSNGDNYAPLGTLTIKEITPPYGYLPNSTTYVMTVTDRDFVHTLLGEVNLYYDQNGKGYKNMLEAWDVFDEINGLPRISYKVDEVLMTEPIKKGGIRLRKCDDDALDTLRAKFVYQGGDIDYQGDASLKGAKFTIKLAPGMKDVKSPFAEDGTPLPEDEWRLVSSDEIMTTITTDANGYAQTGNRDLPCAAYVVEEAESSPGYLLPEGWKRTVLVENDGVLHDVTTGEDGTTSGDSLMETGAADEPVMRGGLDILKVDRDTKKPAPQGNATLQGAELKIYNVSAHEVYVNGTWYPTYKDTRNSSMKVLDYGQPDNPDDYDNCRNPIPYRYVGKYTINLNEAIPVATIYTGADFHAKLSKTTLPYGTYVVYETKAPTGYLFDENFKNGVSFTIDYNGEIESFYSPVFIDNAYWYQYWDSTTRP